MVATDLGHKLVNFSNIRCFLQRRGLLSQEPVLRSNGDEARPGQ